MKYGNRTLVKEFILLGLTDNQKLQVPLFVLFLHIYIVTVVGNAGIITLIRLSPQLKTPMYFLLTHLSFADLCYSSIITPNMLANFLSIKKNISIPACIAQMFLFAIIGSADVFLLTAMAYDRYVAICNPLLYAAIMTNKVCTFLVAGSYLLAVVHSLIHTVATFRLSFCGSNIISNFFCDAPPLLKLSCSDTSLNVMLILFITGVLILGSGVCIFISYACIVSTILKISSSKGRWRAFSTCSSHLMCVTLLFGTLIFMYVRPKYKYSMDQNRVASVFYTIVIPMMNPLIYSLRNKDVKVALKKLKQRIVL